jgi:phage-related protein
VEKALARLPDGAGQQPGARVPATLPAAHREVIAVRMHAVSVRGLVAARHVRGEIYEVRPAAGEVQYRVLFAQEGRWGQILLSLEVFAKKTQKTPPDRIALAERRLADWRRRAAVLYRR